MAKIGKALLLTVGIVTAVVFWVFVIYVLLMGGLNVPRLNNQPRAAANPNQPTSPQQEVPDLCDRQVNPAWETLVTKNSLQREVYEAWRDSVLANGGDIFAPSKCSLPVDSHIFSPSDTINKYGPAQLVTSYRFDAIWHPEVDVTYSVSGGCTFKPLFNQGDAPVAVEIDGAKIHMWNNISNGVSLVGLVTCQ